MYKMTIEKLLSGNRLPILFIGSGLGRRYLNNPDWEGLLKRAYEFIGKGEQEFKALKAKVRTLSQNQILTEGQLNAVIASKLEEEFNEYYFKSDLIESYPEWIENEASPFKNCIAMIVKNNDIFEEKQSEIEEMEKLRGKVSAIVTTNYDTLIEQIFNYNDCSVFVGQSQMFTPLAVDLDELYKIHGCVTRPESIIITEEDYERYKNFAKLFSAKLLTLISENPVIFIGYSLSDPNVQQTLIDLVSCLTDDQINNLQEHFYIVEYKANERELIESKYYFRAVDYDGKEKTFPITVISTDNYIELYRHLGNLTPAMNLNIVKQVKRIVKDIVIESTSTEEIDDPIITVLLEDISQLETLSSQQKFAIAIGDANEIQDQGYALKPLTDIFEDVLFDNKNINPDKLLLGAYENHYLKIQRNIPIYKYVSNAKRETLEQCERVMHYIEGHGDISTYLKGQLKRSVERIPRAKKINEMQEDYAQTERKKYLWMFKNMMYLPIEEVRDFIAQELDKYSNFDGNAKSSFHRLISMYDILKYK